MRKMALDYGEVRIGVALSDPLGIIASGFETYSRRDLTTDLTYFKNICDEKEVDEIIIGLPINMDGSEGERAKATRVFGEKIKEVTGLKVTFLDERLSSVSAERLLIEADVRREDRKKVIDKVSATIILQNFLDINSK